MKITKTLTAFAIAASAFALNAHAGIFDSTPKMYGQPAAAGSAQRTVEVNAGTKKVQVTNGETIKFVVNGQPFTWKFDLYHQEGVLDLATIAPQDIRADGVKVYVAEDPLYAQLYRN